MPPPESLNTPPSVRLPPPAVVVKVTEPVLAIGKLRVSRLVLLLITQPVSVMKLLLSEKALAPPLNVIPATLFSAVRLLFSVVPEVPATPNSQESPLTGVMLAPVQLGSPKLMEVLPTQVSGPLAAKTSDGAKMTASKNASQRKWAITVDLGLRVMSFIIWAWFVEFNDCGNNIGLMDRGRTAEISYAIRKLFSITSSGDNRKLIAAYLRVSRRWLHGSVFWDRPFHRKIDCSCSLTGRQVTRAGMPDLKMTRLLSKSVMGLIDRKSTRLNSS